MERPVSREQRVELTGPDWEPLLRYVALEDMGAWMWMSREWAWGRWLEQYKHVDTRRYVNLDHTGQAWRVTSFLGGRRFVPARAEAQIAEASPYPVSEVDPAEQWRPTPSQEDQ